MSRATPSPAEDRITFIAPGDVPGVRMVMRLDDHPRPSCYLNEMYTIKVLIRTGSYLHYRGRTHDCVSGQVGMLDPGEMLRTSYASRERLPDTIHGMAISPEFMRELAQEFNLPSQSVWFRRPVITHPELFGRITRLLTALQQPARHSALERQSMLANTLETALRTNAEEHRKEPKPRNTRAHIRRARELIHERFSTSISLDELISATGISRCHLLRTFTDEVGVPPHRYQMHLRISRSRELLAKGQSPAFVAAQMGFYDQGHFTNQFRKIVGVTPGRYGRA